ncbi:unnamed protein product, partial [Closterium sp. NIES-53]
SLPRSSHSPGPYLRALPHGADCHAVISEPCRSHSAELQDSSARGSACLTHAPT